MQSSKVVLGCAMHWNASRRLHLQSWRVESRTEKLLRQQSWRLLLTVRARLTVPTAGHERKHNACRADIGGCVSGHTYISRVESPQNVCRGSVEECNQAHAGICPQNQAQGRQARDRRAEAALAAYLYVVESSVCVRKVKKPPVTCLAQKGRIAKGRTP